MNVHYLQKEFNEFQKYIESCFKDDIYNYDTNYRNLLNKADELFPDLLEYFGIPKSEAIGFYSSYFIIDLAFFNKDKYRAIYDMENKKFIKKFVA